MESGYANAPLIVSGDAKYIVMKPDMEGMVLIAINDTPNLDETVEHGCWHLGLVDVDELRHFANDFIPIGLRARKMRDRHLEATFSADERYIHIRAKGPAGTTHSFLLQRTLFKETANKVLGGARRSAL